MGGDDDEFWKVETSEEGELVLGGGREAGLDSTWGRRDGKVLRDAIIQGNFEVSWKRGEIGRGKDFRLTRRDSLFSFLGPNRLLVETTSRSSLIWKQRLIVRTPSLLSQAETKTDFPAGFSFFEQLTPKPGDTSLPPRLQLLSSRRPLETTSSSISLETETQTSSLRGSRNTS